MKPRTCVPVPKIENDSYDWYARHDWALKQTAEKKCRAVFIGDSITHFWAGWNGVDHGSEVWNKYFDGKPVFNLGYGFDRTQNVLWRLEHGELAGQTPETAVLCIGTNQFSITENYDGDTPEDAVAGICACVEKLQTMFPDMTILLMSLFPRCWSDPYFREHISCVNALLAEKYGKSAGGKIIFLDIAGEYLLPDGTQDPACFQQDLCHLCGEGYERWVRALLPYLTSLY